MVDSAIAFLPSVDSKFDLRAILAKPSSIQQGVYHRVDAALPSKIHDIDKRTFDPVRFLREEFPPLPSGHSRRKVVIVDIGGYFSPVVTAQLEDEPGFEILGVVEDTENGHKRYQDALRHGNSAGVRVYSVARSPLKKPENHLVGVAITFSIEALLRQSNIVLQSRRAGVMGFGPIGRSAAHALRNRGIPVSVCEVDPIKLATAAAQGFKVFHYDHHLQDFMAGLNLVVSATGAGAQEGGVRPLNGESVRYLDRDTFLASVTSADDEIDLEGISLSGYRAQRLPYNQDVAKYVFGDGSGVQKAFYLMAGGNAVNFLHEGVVGPAIQLLQGEIVACVNELLQSTGSDGAPEFGHTA